MKTWSEDNWFTRLDRLFEKGKLSLPKHSTDTDKVNFKKLDIDNIDEFPKLKELLFSLVSLTESIPMDFTKLGFRLFSLVYGIAYRDDKEGVCKRRAEIFKEVLIDSFLDNCRAKYLDPVEEYIKAHNSEDTNPSDLDPYKVRLGMTLDEFEENLAHMRERVEELEPQKLSLDGKSADVNSKSVIFDVRKGIVCINATSSLISELYGSYRKPAKFVKWLAEEYGCSSFRRGLPAAEGGESESQKVEKDYCTAEFVETFQENVYPVVMGYFKDLPERIYHKLQRISKAHIVTPARGDTPAVEALHTATATAQWFKDDIGCVFVNEEPYNTPPRVSSSTAVRTLKETYKLWNPIYRADVVYLVDDPEKSYSDGTPAKKYLSVQVKNGKSHLGEGTVDDIVLTKLRSACKKVEKPEEEAAGKAPGLTTEEQLAIQTVFRGLCRGGYIVTNKSWDDWIWLPSDYSGIEPLRLGKRRPSTPTEYNPWLKYSNHTFRLRVSKESTKDPEDEYDVYLDLIE